VEPGQGDLRHVRSSSHECFLHTQRGFFAHTKNPYNVPPSAASSHACGAGVRQCMFCPSPPVHHSATPPHFAPRDHRGYLTYDAVKRMREDMRVREVLADEFEQLLKDR
jgi:hypothetical protein